MKHSHLTTLLLIVAAAMVAAFAGCGSTDHQVADFARQAAREQAAQTSRPPAFTAKTRSKRRFHPQKEVHLSHIVQIQTHVRDAEAVRAACTRLGLPPPVEGTIRLYSSTETGLAVKFPGWRYPAVCQLESGQVKFDIFRGRWGNQQELDRFLQAYAVERARIEARKKGYSVTEQSLADGSIKLTVQVTGGAA